MSKCSQCGIEFSCGMQDTAQACWCAAVPTKAVQELDANGEAQSCMCARCLSALRNVATQTN